MPFSTKTDLVNASLSSMGEPEIRNFDDDTVKTAVEARRWFDHTVDIELIQFDWPFAIRRVSIVKDGTDPAFGWTSRYAIPADSIRFFPVTEDGEETGVPVPHKNEGGFILVDSTEDLCLRYVVADYDPANWSAAFTDVMIAALAVRLAENVTGISQAISTASARYEAASQRARRFEGRQAGTPAEPYVSDWFEARTE